MYRDGLGVLAGWGRFLALFRQQPLAFITYGIVYLVLSVAIFVVVGFRRLCDLLRRIPCCWRCRTLARCSCCPRRDRDARLRSRNSWPSSGPSTPCSHRSRRRRRRLLRSAGVVDRAATAARSSRDGGRGARDRTRRHDRLGVAERHVEALPSSRSSLLPRDPRGAVRRVG